MANLTDELDRSNKRYESEKADFKKTITQLELQLAEKNKTLDELNAEIKRYKVLEAAQNDPNSAAGKFQSELKARDDRIGQLQERIRHMEDDRNDEMVRLNKKMELVMDEKDHQIKVSRSQYRILILMSTV